jgi:ketosteroid isomerase-like protein
LSWVVLPFVGADTGRAMSQQNVRVVRSAWEAWRNGDLQALAAAFDERAECARVPPMPDTQTYYGPEGLLEPAAAWIEQWADFEQEPAEFFDTGDQVVARVNLTSQGEASGVPVAATYWYRYTVRDGKVHGLHIHQAREQALEAAGLRE